MRKKHIVFISAVLVSLCSIFFFAQKSGAFIGSGYDDGISLYSVDAKELSLTFDEYGYVFNDIIAGKSDVPRIFAAVNPKNIKDLKKPKQKQTLFLKMMLPLTLRANEDILEDRKKLIKIKKDFDAGNSLSKENTEWVNNLAKKYKAKGEIDEQLKKLYVRVDAVPPALCLTQAVIESAWGTSRFAIEGNALFGEWTNDGTGIIPAKRSAGLTHRIRAFKNLAGAIKSYMRNTPRGYLP